MKIIAWGSIAIAAIVFTVGGLYFAGPESVQHAMRDTKANLVGTHRIAYVINPYTNQEIRTFEDTGMRFDRREDGGRTLWLGDSDRKVDINRVPIVIIEDQP